MRLLIDAGNTRIKWAIQESCQLPAGNAPTWLAQGWVAHADSAQLAVAWQVHAVQEVWIANVAGSAMSVHLRELLEQSFPTLIPQFLQSQAELAGVRNRYTEPEKLGCDRFASAIAVHHLHPTQHCLVATCGTATTLDAISAAGDFNGGMILPGLKLMAEALAKNTALLPNIAEQLKLAPDFAISTEHAIASGCISAQIGAITSAYTRLAAQAQKLHCVISGGAAPYLLPHLAIQAEHLPNLVLTGLAVVAQFNPDSN